MLIKDINTLKEIIPTIIGDNFSLYKQELENAEQWLENSILGRDLFSEIKQEAVLESKCKLVIAYSAFHSAIPTLDLVNTANGFAVVNDQKLAPASSYRVNGLRDSILLSRHIAEANLYEYLEDREPIASNKWATSPGTTIVRNTLLPTKRTFEKYGIAKYSYDEWRTLKAKHRVVIINFIAPIISAELTQVLINDGDSQSVNNALIIDDICYAFAAYFTDDIATGDSLLLPTREAISSNLDKYPEFESSKQNKKTNPIANSKGIGTFI